FHFLGESYGIENPDITQFLGTSTLDYEYFRFNLSVKCLFFLKTVLSTHKNFRYTKKSLPQCEEGFLKVYFLIAITLDFRG
ncbi:hypothetical protein EV207_1131, partial [Scopulibacillus darangshiensis]